MKCWRAALSAVFAMTSFTALAAEYPTPKQGDWIAKDFKFHNGQTMPQLRLHYTTVGEPNGQPVLVLHGSGGSAASMLTPVFAGELFGPGQPLDASKYYIIIPDGIGHGQSAKPSDGMKTGFPKYDYADMVDAQYRLVTEGLGIKHLRLVMGSSMGGMHTWMWGYMYPDLMDGLIPIASQPIQISGRNWIARRIAAEAIRQDPGWNNGFYDKNPTQWTVTAPYGFLQTENVLQILKMAPTREIGSTHERVGVPLTSTMHAPHCASPQPKCGLFSLSSSRSTYNRGVSGSQATSCSTPLTASRTGTPSH